MKKFNVLPILIVAVSVQCAIATAQPAWKPLVAGSSFDHIVVNSQGDIVVTSDGRAALRSKDRGATWNTFIARSDTVEYYGCDGQGSHYAKIRGTGICRSDDDGQTWSIVLPHERYFIHHIGFVHDLIILESGNLLMWTQNPQNGVLYSTNRGASWVSYNDGIKSIGTTRVLCSTDAGELLAQDATYRVYRRYEHNSAWEESDAWFPYPYGPGKATVNFISIAPNGIMIAEGIVGYVSWNSGLTWNNLVYRNAALAMRNRNRSIFDSLGNIYLSSYDYSTLSYDIAKYSPSLDIWSSIWYNLSTYGVTVVRDLAALHDGSVFAATDAGLYTLKQDLTNISDPPGYYLLKADLYPSPAGDEVTFSIRCDRNDDLDVSLCTILGRILETFVMKRGVSDERTLKIQLHGLPAGLYLLNIRGGTKNSVIPVLKH